MILASHVNDASRVERCRGQLETVRVQLELSRQRKSLLGQIKEFIARYEEFFFIGLAFGIGLAVVVLCVINSVLQRIVS